MLLLFYTIILFSAGRPRTLRGLEPTTSGAGLEAPGCGGGGPYLDLDQGVPDALGLRRVDGDGQHPVGLVQPGQHGAQVLLQGGRRTAGLRGPGGAEHRPGGGVRSD